MDDIRGSIDPPPTLDAVATELLELARKIGEVLHELNPAPTDVVEEAEVLDPVGVVEKMDKLRRQLDGLVPTAVNLKSIIGRL